MAEKHHPTAIHLQFFEFIGLLLGRQSDLVKSEKTCIISQIPPVELVLLSNLVADYEDEHFPIKKPTLIEVLKLRMFEMGLTQSALATKLGMNQSKISEILSGKSEPTLKQARTISRVLDISPAIVLGV